MVDSDTEFETDPLLDNDLLGLAEAKRKTERDLAVLGKIGTQISRIRARGFR